MTQVSLNQEYYFLSAQNEHVLDGYGEYFVYSKNAIELTEDVFKNVYKIFNTYNHNPTKEIAGSITRFISSEVKAIYDHLEIFFIPRTLHDLLYIHVAIKEDLKNEDLKEICCWRNSSVIQRAQERGSVSKSKKYDNCWHIVYSSDYFPLSNDAENLIHLAYRFNQYCIEKLKPQGYFTGQQIADFTEKEIQFLQHHIETYKNVDAREIEGNLAFIFGVTNNPKKRFQTMKIKNSNQLQIIRNAVALECSSVAKNALFFYRGGYWKQDCNITFESRAISLSYGTSLFAGCVRDVTACVFYHTIIKQRDGYVVIIPFDEYSKTPLYFPKLSALTQLLAGGELFHGRSKISSFQLGEPSEDDEGSRWYRFPGLQGFVANVEQSEIGNYLMEATSEQIGQTLSECHQRAYLIAEQN